LAVFDVDFLAVFDVDFLAVLDLDFLAVFDVDFLTDLDLDLDLDLELALDNDLALVIYFTIKSRFLFFLRNAKISLLLCVDVFSSPSFLITSLYSPPVPGAITIILVCLPSLFSKNLHHSMVQNRTVYCRNYSGLFDFAL